MMALASPASAAEPSVDTIDGILPGETFRYGIHDLKWSEDTNGNRLMDLGEVQREANGQWVELNQADFKVTVERRRTGMYLPNAYTYKETPTRDLELYINFPTDWKADDQRPAMVWFFGGAWSTGNPTAFKPQSEYFAKRGVVSICVDYRIAKVDGNAKNDHRAAMDGKTAVRWVRKNAAKLGIDPDRIMTGGDSAGGHVAVATQISTMNDPADDQTISAEVSALLLHNPYVVRLSEESWVFQIDFKQLPPVWVAYGLLDKAAYNDNPDARHTERNGESFIAELEQAGIPLRTYIKEGMSHGFCSGPHLDPSTRDIDNFLQENNLLTPPTSEFPDKISRYVVIQHMQAVNAGKLKPSVPQTLEFPTK
jgi:acetyl esterase/lipase